MVLVKLNFSFFSLIVNRSLLFFMATASTSASNDDPKKEIEIDGSYLEGGGQILRISTALSVLLNKPIQVTRIRANRKGAGLKAQHLTGIQLLAEISQAKLTNAQLKSTEITFAPTQLKSGDFVADIGTAGSICLLMQNSIPCIIFGPDSTRIFLRGGTNVAFSPPIDYFELIFQPMSQKLGMDIKIETSRRGFNPQGGGEVTLSAKPIRQLNPVQLTEFGTLKRIYGRAFVAGILAIKIAQRMANAASFELKQNYGNVTIDIEVVKEKEGTFNGVGCGIIVVAESTTGCLLAGSAIGERGVPAEEVAKQATSTLIEDLDSNSCVDQYMQDQLIIFMALANGTSKVRAGPLTQHTKTAIHFAELLTGAKFNIITDKNTNSQIIECTGIGFTNRFLKSN